MLATMTGTPSSICCLAMSLGSSLGRRLMRGWCTGSSGRAELRASARFMRDLAWLVEMYIGGHPWSEFARRAQQLSADLNGPAGWVHHRAHHRDSRCMFFVRHADRGHRDLLAGLHLAGEFFRKSEFNFHGGNGSHPEQLVVFRDLLPGADIAARNHTIKGGDNTHLLLLELQRAQRRLRVLLVLFFALDLELRSGEFVARMVEFLLGYQVGFHHAFGARQVIFLHFCFGLPVLHV